MFMLKAEEDGSVKYLLEGNKYKVGRKDADILITNDKSISRTHAVLNVTNNELTVTDCGAKYNTYVDDVKIDHNVPINVKSGSNIRFGGLKSIYSVEKISLRISFSGINSEKKANIIKKLSFMSVTISQNWSKECTHVTVEGLKLTPKVLCAIVHNQIIIPLNYWHDYIECVKTNIKLPNHEDYKPNVTETSLDKNVNLSYNPNRRNLFNNKIFVFPNAKLENDTKALIEIAGGNSILFDNLKLTKEEILKSTTEYIFVQDITNSQKFQNNNFNNTITYLKQNNRFSIPISDLGLAICYSSCEKHCNSYYNKIDHLFNTKSTTAYPPVKVEIAPVTQTQLTNAVQPKKEVVIPETEVFNYTEQFKEMAIKNVTKSNTVYIDIENDSNMDDKNLSLTKKRKEELPEPNLKKAKLDNDTSITPKFFTSTPQEDGTRTKTTPKFNPFSASSLANNKKRVGEEITNSSKKVCFDKNTCSTQDSKKINPFYKNSLKSVQRDIKNIEKSPLTAKSNNRSSIKLAAKNIENHLTIITDEEMEKYQWISKSNVSINTILNKTANKEIDEETKLYIASFTSADWKINTISVQTKKQILKEPNYSKNNAPKNFKKFKKVLPLHPQTTIISTKKINITK